MPLLRTYEHTPSHGEPSSQDDEAEFENLLKLEATVATCAKCTVQQYQFQD
jgi:hypothetical protein